MVAFVHDHPGVTVPGPQCLMPVSYTHLARNHLYVHAHVPGARNRRFGLLTRRIEQGQHPDELPFALLICPGYAKGTEAASRKLIDSLLGGRRDLADVGCHLQNYLRGPFGHKELLPVRSLDGSFCALMHRVEGLKVKYPVSYTHLRPA